MKPTSTKTGIPKIKPVIANANGALLAPNLSSNQLASTSAPLDFSITLPNIAPRPTIKATLPKVPPIPLINVGITFPIGMPAESETAILTSPNAING